MLKRLFLFVILGFSVAFCNAQLTTVLDFEDPGTSAVFEYFGHFPVPGPGVSSIVPNPDPSGINTSANVSNFHKPEQAQVWAGGFPNPQQDVKYTLSSGATEICVDVYMDHIGNLSFKLENSTNGGPNWILEVANTQINQWEQLCFDLSLPSFEAPFQAASGFDFKKQTFFYKKI